MNATTKPEAAPHHATPRESSKILGDCRDLAISRLTISFAQMMDRVGDLLMDRANKSDVREEQRLYLDARYALKGERPALMAEFEKQLRRSINERIAGKVADKADFSKADGPISRSSKLRRWTSRCSRETLPVSSRTFRMTNWRH